MLLKPCRVYVMGYLRSNESSVNEPKVSQKHLPFGEVRKNSFLLGEDAFSANLMDF